ncbi:hypothetical protein [Streptomyces syringium]|uniref:hypothetical protein n=1 Tax=Streptomyces syringium TaxID=76729 RepID=UPI00341C0787
MHVFTGHADSRSAAVRIAHEVYDQATAAQQARLEVPGRRPDGWTARGYRPGWELDWKAATAGRWNDPYSWTHADDARTGPGRGRGAAGCCCTRASRSTALPCARR